MKIKEASYYHLGVFLLINLLRNWENNRLRYSEKNAL